MKSNNKTECLNPHTGRIMNIPTYIYTIFHKAILEILKTKEALTYTEIVDGIHEIIRTQKIKFSKSVSWYAVSVKNDMEARGIIETFGEKGKKLNRLKSKRKK